MQQEIPKSLCPKSWLVFDWNYEKAERERKEAEEERKKKEEEERKKNALAAMSMNFGGAAQRNMNRKGKVINLWCKNGHIHLSNSRTREQILEIIIPNTAIGKKSIKL